ncbi:hypothetical protein AAVH_02992 [Aphelenchoides avenae]|nr:hypothetical protein AAVH_02992 [Aphelenchus avenae]
MKVRVDYNGQKQIFDSVEELTFEDFKAIVAAHYGITGEISLMLGSNVINLGPHQKLQEFGVVNSDILRIQLESEANDNRMDVTPASALADQPTVSNPDITQSLQLEELVMESVESFAANNGFHEISRSLADASVFRLRLSHANAASQCEIHATFFQDANDTTEVTSVQLSTFKFRAGYPAARQLLSSLLLLSGSDSITAVINDVLTTMRDEVTGPDNTLLNYMFFRGIGRNVLTHLNARDVLNLEATCRYAVKKCRSPGVEHDVWKLMLRKKYGDAAVEQCERLGTPFRAAYRQRCEEAKRHRDEQNQARQDALLVDHDRLRRPPRNPFSPLGPLPQHPMIPDPRNPLGIPPPNNPPFGPAPHNPWEDPLREPGIFPSRPRIGPQPGQPHIFPTGGDFGHPGGFPDPDMPQGPRQGPGGQQPRGPGFRPPNFDRNWYG